ncbi:MAG: ATP-dependent protease LonB [Candidatus Nanoarchaeia archaeon]|nr:ATP-dependent protease LonB [Candidatus Haiyanarchaeum thermophilum]MCW1308177.1 ATP-dependent protease LonB [Candidatus Haiyanarchaeum thermophilum]
MRILKELDFKTTEEIEVPKKLVDRVIGQEKAIEIIKKAAIQKRNVLLIGEPGTGKSMIGQALAELLPKEKLVDILCFPNPEDENNPIIKTVPAGMGSKIVREYKLKAIAQNRGNPFLTIFLIFLFFSILTFLMDFFISSEKSEILQAASRISSTLLLITFLIIFTIVFAFSRVRMERAPTSMAPKLLVDNSNREAAPFIDATGAHEGALLGDVLHDPFQSGGLGTPPHERVVAGAIHKANGGVLFVDEIATLKPEMQVELLTVMQEKKYPITGRSERSAGAMTRTQPVPCDFIFVAAGTPETIKYMHPALRSRIRGYGYEIYMNDVMEDTPENRKKLARFVAQEVEKEKGRIPHFTREAVIEIIKEARRRAGRRGYLTLKLRDLGGLVRVAGDIAREEGAKYVEARHVEKARKLATHLEHQIAERYSLEKKEYQVIETSGSRIGKVNGLAIIANTEVGLVLPIEASVVPSMEKEKGKIIATGKLGEIAKEAVENVSAVIKRCFGKDLRNYDIHIQFLQTYEGVEGDSASISVATAVISALENLPVRQDVAMTGSLSIRGEVLPVGGINGKLEAAKEIGVKEVIIPKMNEKDVIIPGIKIIPASNIIDVLEHAIVWKDVGRLKRLKKALRGL